MWVIADTTQGFFLEYWRDGAMVLSFTAPGVDFHQLELLKKQLNNIGLTPRETDD